MESLASAMLVIFSIVLVTWLCSMMIFFIFLMWKEIMKGRQ